MTDRNAFGHDTTTDEVLEGVDLAGKTALVTGASGGLGAETARAFASKGASVIITARDIDKAQGVVDSITESTGNDQIRIEQLELGSFSNIRAFADRINDGVESIDILANNAGVMVCPFGHTADGFETQFGTNHLGHFLMTCLIAPTLVAGGPTRVVSLSSRGHHLSPVVFDDINFESREYDKWGSYGQSKTANILFAVELDRRLRDRGVRAVAVHPGVIMTDLARHMTAADFEEMSNRREGVPMQLKPVEAGAATTVYAATAPELDGQGAVYLEDCHVAEVVDDDPTGGVRSYAVDPVLAERLWTISEGMVGQEFALS